MLLYRGGLRVSGALRLHPKDLDRVACTVPVLVGKGGWTDRREIRFYGLCFLLLCLMIVLIAVSLMAGDWRWAGSVFLVLTGFAPVVWRALV